MNTMRNVSSRKLRRPKSLRAIVATSLLAAVAVGCASSAPTELSRARSAYQGASRGPAPHVAPADLNAARETLNVAEQSYEMNGNNQETRDIAYAAERRAQFADTRARTALAAQKLQSAQIEEATLKEQQAKAANAEMEARLLAEQRQREEAEKFATMANAELMKIASVKNDARGTVITLSGSVLFASGKSQLLPSAQKRLGQVAEVLSQGEKDSQIRIEGFTDSTGSASLNERLSQARADAVKQYLASNGVSSERMTSMGMGPSNPVADNASAEGRANNRRVEIILLNKDNKEVAPMR